jgi:hypothetical protein
LRIGAIPANRRRAFAAVGIAAMAGGAPSHEVRPARRTGGLSRQGE